MVKVRPRLSLSDTAGVNVAELSGDHLRGECLCVVPQEPVLLSGSLSDNVALGRC